MTPQIKWYTTFLYKNRSRASVTCKKRVSHRATGIILYCVCGEDQSKNVDTVYVSNFK